MSADSLGETSEGVIPVRDRAVADDAWSTFSLMLSGLLVWGGIGWCIDRLLGFDALFLPVGFLVGMGAALYVVFARYGRSPVTAATMEDLRDRGC